MGFCTNCGTKIQDGYDFCPECGTRVGDAVDFENGFILDNQSTKICPKCGDKMPNDTFYCFNCGYTFSDDASENNANTIQGMSVDEIQKGQPYREGRLIYEKGEWKNKWIALFLCVFFGLFGIHKHYEGKHVMGVIYFFTLGLFVFGWFIDIIILLLKPNPYFIKQK